MAALLLLCRNSRTTTDRNLRTQSIRSAEEEEESNISGGRGGGLTSWTVLLRVPLHGVRHLGPFVEAGGGFVGTPAAGHQLVTVKTKQPKHVRRHVFYSPFFICAFVSESFGKRVVIDLQFGYLNVERRGEGQ